MRTEEYKSSIWRRWSSRTFSTAAITLLNCRSLAEFISFNQLFSEGPQWRSQTRKNNSNSEPGIHGPKSWSVDPCSEHWTLIMKPGALDLGDGRESPTSPETWRPNNLSFNFILENFHFRLEIRCLYWRSFRHLFSLGYQFGHFIIYFRRSNMISIGFSDRWLVFDPLEGSNLIEIEFFVERIVDMSII